MRVKRNSRGGRFEVSADGHGMTGRAGLALVAEVADTVGLTAALSRAAGHARRWTVHDPGVVLRDLVLTLVDGGDALRHMAVLSGQPQLFGTPASPATANRTVVAVADDPEAMAGIAAARAAARAAVWAAGGAPPVVVAAADDDVEGPHEPLCLDLDATISVAHSDDKDGAAATFKRTWGFHPMMAYLDRGDGGGEALAGLLRPGNAAANNTADHIAAFDLAFDQLPELPEGLDLLVRTDCAGASRGFLDHVRAAGWRFSTGLALSGYIKDAIGQLDDDAWVAATGQDGAVRDRAHVAEITDLVGLANWPDRSRVIVRREPLRVGAQPTLDDIDGYRFTAFLTDQPDRDIALLDVRHRAHARVEDRIRAAKNLGLRTLPCDTFTRNVLWLQLVLIAEDLLTFTQVLTLERDELRRAEPHQLRYKLLHVPARITRTARRTRLNIHRDWPWAHDLVTAFTRLRGLPVPAG